MKKINIVRKKLESKARDLWTSKNPIKKIIASPYAIVLLLKGKNINYPGEIVWCGGKNYYLAIWKCGNSTIRGIINKKVKKIKFLSPSKTKIKKNMFLFTFVRNPYTRVLSVYLDKSRNQASAKYTYHYQGPLNKISGKDIDFDKFVKEISKIPDKKLDVHLKPYSEYLKKFPKINFIGKLESFERDWDYVAKKINFPSSDSIKCSNKNKKGYSLDDYYTPKLKKIIYEKYKDDFERFGYKK